MYHREDTVHSIIAVCRTGFQLKQAPCSFQELWWENLSPLEVPQRLIGPGFTYMNLVWKSCELTAWRVQ